MTFKQNWEKAHEQCQLPIESIENMVRLAFPAKKLKAYQVISGGCANLNMKIELKDSKEPFILRIYLRDKEAAFREKKLAQLLRSTVPVPMIYFIGDEKKYRFAICEFVEGITLRDLILSDRTYNMGDILFEAGHLLSKISKYEFPKAGFFDKDLKVTESISEMDYLNFTTACLENKKITSRLSPIKISKIRYFFEKNHLLLPSFEDKQLVHADFDPSNILVHQADGEWRISGIIDWEFSFSGSVLCDVANMLRYAHHMPLIYEQAFLKGLKQGGVLLPNNWRTRIHLLNIVSLLDCLVRQEPAIRPNQYSDISSLIEYILGQLENRNSSPDPDSFF